MPSALVAADKLPDLACALNEKVRGDFQAANGLKVRMGIPIELIGEKLVHGAVAKFPGRQADGVNHNQVDDGRWGARAKVGRLAFFSVLAPALLPIDKAHGSKSMALKAVDRLRLGDELQNSSDPIDPSARLIQAGERRNGHRRAWGWVETS